jgi:hypothetical protein
VLVRCGGCALDPDGRQVDKALDSDGVPGCLPGDYYRDLLRLFRAAKNGECSAHGGSPVAIRYVHNYEGLQQRSGSPLLLNIGDSAGPAEVDRQHMWRERPRDAHRNDSNVAAHGVKRMRIERTRISA